MTVTDEQSEVNVAEKLPDITAWESAEKERVNWSDLPELWARVTAESQGISLYEKRNELGWNIIMSLNPDFNLG